MSKRSFGSYIAELIIVIIGVTVAFWIGNKADQSKQEETVRNYYAELIEDISADTSSLKYAIEFNEAKRKQLEHAQSFYQEPDQFKDSIIQSVFNVGNYYFFEPNDVTYRSIIASGDLKLIHSRDVKKSLVKLYGYYHNIDQKQNGFLEALDQNYFPLLVEKVDYSTGIPNDENFHKNLQIKNYQLYTINEIDIHLKWYRVTLKIARSAIEILQKEESKLN